MTFSRAALSRTDDERMNQHVHKDEVHCRDSFSNHCLAISFSAQSVERAPSKPTRPFVVMPAQSLSDLERKLQSENKAEDLIGGEGMQLRVAVQHDMNRPTAAAELHDASDDVYYVLAGTAT